MQIKSNDKPFRLLSAMPQFLAPFTECSSCIQSGDDVTPDMFVLFALQFTSKRAQILPQNQNTESQTINCCYQPSTPAVRSSGTNWL